MWVDANCCSERMPPRYAAVFVNDSLRVRIMSVVVHFVGSLDFSHVNFVATVSWISLAGSILFGNESYAKTTSTRNQELLLVPFCYCHRIRQEPLLHDTRYIRERERESDDVDREDDGFENEHIQRLVIRREISTRGCSARKHFHRGSGCSTKLVAFLYLVTYVLSLINQRVPQNSSLFSILIDTITVPSTKIQRMNSDFS